MNTCSTCRYARMMAGDRMCARFPRTVQRDPVVNSNVSMLPMVVDTDWCGEYRRGTLWRRFVQRFFA